MPDSSGSKGKALRRIRSSEGFIIGVVSLALFTDVFIYGMIIPVIPSALVERAGILEQDAQYWIAVLLAVYGATVLIGSPLFGVLADYSGSRKMPFVLGLLALGTSTGLFMVGRTPAALIVARALQGFSAAAVWVVGTALVVDTVGQDRVGQALGRTTIALTWGGVLGPMLGGVTYEKWGYYGTFYIPIGLVALDIFLRFSMIEPTAAQKKGRHLGKSQKDKAVCVWTDGFPHYAHDSLSSPAEQQWRGVDEESPLLIKSRSAKSESENKDKKSFAVVRLLVSTSLWVALLAAVMTASLFAALETTIPLFVMQKFHWSSSGAGLVFLPLSLPSFAADWVGRWVDRAGARIPGTIAFALAAFAIICLRFVQHGTTADQVLLIGLLILVGVTIVMAQVAFMTEVSRVVDSAVEERPELFGGKSPIAQAYGLFNMAIAAGQMVGPSLGGSIKAHAGWEAMTLVVGLLCASTSLLTGLSGGLRVKTTGKSDDSAAVGDAAV